MGIVDVSHICPFHSQLTAAPLSTEGEGQLCIFRFTGSYLDAGEIKEELRKVLSLDSDLFMSWHMFT